MNKALRKVGFDTASSGGDFEREDSVFSTCAALKILRTVYSLLSNHPPLISVFPAVNGLSVFPLQVHISSSFERAESVAGHVSREALDTIVDRKKT
ncbi:hypothetical protein N2597_04220 [Rhizobium sophoriradicis]|uniref:hypothetical protein n=1 Tax=Rhizobium sophoriradicis TaxID=1535245 RepID=UPI0016101770|nr:hypothetical protein N2597_04220 [Rhizobium leguminosarum bv. phaseoli]